MSLALLTARVLLGVVFLVAAVAKLFDLPGSRRAVRDFGLPEALVVPVGTALPVIELVVASTLIPTQTAWWAALSALTLLALFSVGMAGALIRGRRPDCHCFGQVYSQPVSWRSIARNGLLAVPALFIVVSGHGSAGADVLGWLGASSASTTAALIVALLALALASVAVWLAVQLMAQNGRLLARLDALELRGSASGNSPSGVQDAPRGLPVGTAAPAFALPDVAGETVSLDALRAAHKPLLLTFIDPQCGPCMTLLPYLARWQEEVASAATVVLLSRGLSPEGGAKVAELALRHVLVDPSGTVAESYQIESTPSMLLVHADGTIGAPLATGSERIGALVAYAVGQPPPIPSHLNPSI